MIPDRSVLIEGNGVAARSAEGEWVLAYLPTNTSITVSLSAVTSSKTVLISWVNPLNGERNDIGQYPTSARPHLTPPANWEDALLLAQKAAD